MLLKQLTSDFNPALDKPGIPVLELVFQVSSDFLLFEAVLETIERKPDDIVESPLLFQDVNLILQFKFNRRHGFIYVILIYLFTLFYIKFYQYYKIIYFLAYCLQVLFSAYSAFSHENSSSW